MPERPRSERATQNRLVAHLTAAVADGGLGFHQLGDWSKGRENFGIEAKLLQTNLLARGYTEAQIAAALLKLRTVAQVIGTTLYQASLRTYQLIRYGVDVQTEAGQPHTTVHLIDWTDHAANDFALAEEVTLRGGHERRPDIVLYINGLAIAVIELKRSSVDVGDGIRQLITNQEGIFNEAFFPTVQLLLAGSDAQGLRYGTVGTPEKFFVEWKDEDAPAGAAAKGALLDRPVAQMLRPDRLLDRGGKHERRRGRHTPRLDDDAAGVGREGGGDSGGIGGARREGRQRRREQGGKDRFHVDAILPETPAVVVTVASGFCQRIVRRAR